MKIEAQFEMLFDQELTIEKILHLPSLVAESQNLLRNVPSEFDDVLSDIDESRHASMEVLWQFFSVKDEESEDAENDLMNLQMMHGYWDEIEQCQFLVRFNKAKRFYSSKDSWHSGGIYYTQWIAAPSINKALQDGKKWAKQMDKIDLANMKKE